MGIILLSLTKLGLFNTPHTDGVKLEKLEPGKLKEGNLGFQYKESLIENCEAGLVAISIYLQ